MTRAQLDNMSIRELHDRIKYCEMMRDFYTPKDRKAVWNADIKTLQAEIERR